jgi:hypothetical protein
MNVGELTWVQFQRLDRISKLPLNEQTKEFQYYIDSVSNNRLHQNKGDGPFLLQENSFYLLQENGNKIRL